MGKNKERNYLLKYTNKHLLNIFERNYYVELGSVDLEILNDLLSGEIIEFNSIADLMILTEGTGAITTDFDHEIDYQLNYLLGLIKRNSSSKLFLTAGLIKYHSTIKQELFAPLLLIPIKIYKNTSNNWEIYMCSEALENELLMKRLRELTIEPLPNAEDFKTAYDIDLYCQRVAKASGCQFEIGNFLTFALTEYPDLNFFNEELLDTSSFFEYPVSNIYEQALTKMRPVVPSNIYQKYIMVKANRNESFAVSGKLKSGKTSTIINIITSLIQKNKQILYVNSDQAAINNMEFQLNKLGLGNYTFNFVNPYSFQNITPELSRNQLPPAKKEVLKLNRELLDFDRLLDNKYYGYRYREIVEKQLLLFFGGYTHEPLPLNGLLEKFEVEVIYEKLLEIEAALATVGPFQKCGWHTLESYYTKSDIKEVQQATLAFQNIQNKLQEEYVNFNERHHFITTATIKDAHRLIYILKGFSDNLPPHSWHVVKDYKKAVFEINVLKKLIFDYEKHQTKLKNTYHGEIENIDIDNIFKTLFGPYYEATDNIYIDRILYNLKSLKTVTKKVNQNKKVINESLTALKTTFQVKVFEDYMYDLLVDIDYYLDGYQTDLNWVKNSYDNNPEILEDYFTDYENYQEYMRTFAEIKHYLRKGTTIDYPTLYTLLTTESNQKVIKKVINFKTLKEEKITLVNIIAYLKRYLELEDILNAKLKKFRFKEYIELANNYLNYKAYFDLVDRPRKEKLFIKKILESYLGKIDKKKNSAKERLSAFRKTYLDNLAIIKQLKYYNINVTEPLPTKKLAALYQFVQFFNNIYNMNDKYRKLFKKNNLVLYEDYKDLNRDYQNHHRIFNDLRSKESQYQHLYGDYFNGFKTDYVLIERLIAYFELFLEIVVDYQDLDQLLKPETLMTIIYEGKNLENLYEKWYSSYRRFSKMFSDSKAQFFDNTFLANINIIKGFVDDLASLPAVFTIIENLVLLRRFNLEDLASGIYSGLHSNNLGNRFLATLYDDYQHKIEEAHPLLKDFNYILEHANLYTMLEKELINHNIEYFYSKKSNPTERYRNRLKTIGYCNCNRMMEIIGRDYQVYLSDLDFFNGPINLRQFDTIIIDDAHLDNSNKYYRLDEILNQVLIFGDKSFTSSVANNLMQRISPPAITPLKYRYTKLSNYFNNQISIDNIYVPQLTPNVEIQRVTSYQALIRKIISKLDASKVINIVFANNNTKFDIYQYLVLEINDFHKAKKLMYNLHLTNAIRDAATSADDIYFLFDDFKNMEADVLDKILTNFNQAENKFYLIYVEDLIEEKNVQLQTRLTELTTPKDLFTPTFNPVVRYLIEELKDYPVEWGVGAIDFIIRGNPTYGFIIIGLDEQDQSLIDKYQHYYQTFSKYGWKIEFIYAPLFVQDPKKMIERILRVVTK